MTSPAVKDFQAALARDAAVEPSRPILTYLRLSRG
jgi:hypothetical protein